jgi:hypothetical protein
LKTEVEKGFMSISIRHELVDPERWVNSLY